MVSETIRDLVWDALYLADARTRYFARTAERLRTWERRLAWLVAVLSSGAVASVLAGQEYRILQVTLSVATALIAAALATYKHDKRVAVGASLSRQWSEIASEYDILWAQVQTVDDEEVIGRYRELEGKASPMDELAISEFQLDEKLWDKCFDAVAVSRGLRQAA